MDRQFPALRGFAILLVVLYHSTGWGMLAPPEHGYPAVEGLGRYVLLTIRQLGVIAVPTFLFISGAFIAYASRGDPPRLSWKFVWNSLNRIVWPYVFWSIVYYLAIYLYRGEIYTPVGYLKNLIVGYPFHFVPLLVFYYLLSPLLVRFARTSALVLLLGIGLYQIALVNIMFPGVLGFTFPGWSEYLALPILATTLAEWAIFFPLGLIYRIKARCWAPVLRRFRWLTLAATVLLFILSLLHVFGVIHVPLAGFLCPLPFVLFIPTIDRRSIPAVRQLETLGKRSYGLYLMHLTVVSLTFLAVRILFPWLMGWQLVLQPLLFAAGVGVPMLVMDGFTRLSRPAFYRVLFG